MDVTRVHVLSGTTSMVASQTPFLALNVTAQFESSSMT